MTTLGSRIKMARGKESQEKFASRLEISKGALGFYERDENLPKADVILKICALTGVSLNWLLRGAESTPPDPPARQGESISSLPFAQQAEQPYAAEPQQLQESACPSCADLKKRLAALEDERWELWAENRTLWKKLCSLLEETVGLRRLKDNVNTSDPSGQAR